MFDGSSWNPIKKLKIHDGSQWQDAKAIYVYDGTSWKKTGSIPTNTVLPVITSNSTSQTTYDLQPGNTLTVSNGTWTDMDGTPATYKYQWYKRKISSSSWEEILNATNSTLTLSETSLPQLKYVGYELRCKVIATNQFGDNDPATPIYTVATGYVLPQEMGTISVNVTSNDIVEFTWSKPIGANDYYVQYQGPEVDFVEVSSLVGNAVPSKGVFVDNGATLKFTVDCGTADGTLGILINPKWVEGSNSLTGYGKNASVSNLKINPASVTSSTSNPSVTGFTFNWVNNNLTPTSWVIYDGSESVASSYMNGAATDTSCTISKFSTGGAVYGSYTITVTGTASRHKQTSWSSTPALSVTVPAAATPVPITDPSIYSAQGRIFIADPGTYTNSSSISIYMYEWFADGQTINIAADSTLNLASTTQYDNKTITCKVSLLLTDLRTLGPYTSNSLTSSPYTPPNQNWTIPNLVGLYSIATTDTYTVAYGSTTPTNTYIWEGKVASQSPAAGSTVSSPTKPTVTVSLYAYEAPSTFTVPDLVGLYSVASTSQYNIGYGSVTSTNTYIWEGKVASQSPAAGTTVNASPKPTITVSLYSYVAPPATYTIPQLVGLYNVASTDNYDIATGADTSTENYVYEGKVASQSPTSGTVVNASPKPTITISLYKYTAPPYFPFFPPAFPTFNYGGPPFFPYFPPYFPFFPPFFPFFPFFPPFFPYFPPYFPFFPPYFPILPTSVSNV